MSNSGKNTRRQLTCYDDLHKVVLSVDSNEEIDFCNWLCEAKQLSVINDFVYLPPSFNLADAVKYKDVDGKERSLYQKHIYSSDFLVTFDGNKHNQLAKELKLPFEALSSECSAWIDIKGTFNINARSFSTDRKWVWLKFKIYICEVIPLKFFAKFGCPEKSRLSPKKKLPRKCFLGYLSLTELFKFN